MRSLSRLAIRVGWVIFDSSSGVERPHFWGCLYLAVQVELKDPRHPASHVARTVKQGLTDFFRAEAARGAHVIQGARHLTLLYDGARARAGIKADDLSNLITPTVVTLLNEAGLE